jgi:hypothetical protein
MQDLAVKIGTVGKTDMGMGTHIEACAGRVSWAYLIENMNGPPCGARVEDAADFEATARPRVRGTMIVSIGFLRSSCSGPATRLATAIRLAGRRSCPSSKPSISLMCAALA